MQIAVWLRPYIVMPSTSNCEKITAVQASSAAAHGASPPPDMNCDCTDTVQLKLTQRLILLFRLQWIIPPNIQILCKCDRASYTRVRILIVATIYLQLIQNRYMFRSFTVLQCSHQHCVQPVASDMEVVG